MRYIKTYTKTHTEPLFCYGTLQLPVVQRSLFASQIDSTPARLRGWRLQAGFDGYLFIRPAPQHGIYGQLLWLTPAQLARADEWEDVPYYQRERVIVSTIGKTLPAWVYTRRHANGRPVAPGSLATKSISSILRALKSV